MKEFTELPDNTLVLRIKKNDQAAFRMLYDRYKGKIYRFILKISEGDGYLAEEIVQMVFIKIWEDRTKIAIHESVINYLYTCARNMFLNTVARQVNEEIIIKTLAEKTISEKSPVENEVELNLLLEEIDRIITLLPPARQKIYRLHHIDHMSQKEIASKLNISENTVESYLRLSGKFMKLMLRPYRAEMFTLLIIYINLVTF